MLEPSNSCCDDEDLSHHIAFDDRDLIADKRAARGPPPPLGPFAAETMGLSGSLDLASLSFCSNMDLICISDGTYCSNENTIRNRLIDIALLNRRAAVQLRVQPLADICCSSSNKVSDSVESILKAVECKDPSWAESSFPGSAHVECIDQCCTSPQQGGRTDCDLCTEQSGQQELYASHNSEDLSSLSSISTCTCSSNGTIPSWSFVQLGESLCASEVAAAEDHGSEPSYCDSTIPSWSFVLLGDLLDQQGWDQTDLEA
ncbi:expressed unknown protein [Seminavis robusta]|uniref:Uncharacterized protein n=1 Tax=Seminavis robusta TaxID=568900 RepID=A0A9N8EM55_9STRA|nr:expressed unknown protein [Seminavis robusta]|eukprot:Sro1159_g247640.1 n/a (259) ;mRNA; r:27486-28262